MYKVLLVDDEPWALMGIKKTLNWDEMGFEVVYETMKSTEALEKILEENIDVVFTDIRMPKISGLELIKKVRERGIDTEFILISGYADFSYAKEAIKQGAFDYCLKPLQFEESDNLLRRLKEHLDNKSKRSSIELLEEIIESNKSIGDIMDEYISQCNCKYFQAVVVDGYFTAPLNVQNLMIRLGKNKTLYFLNVDKSIECLLTNENMSTSIIGISTISNYNCMAWKHYMQADSSACCSFIYNKKGMYFYKNKNIDLINEFVRGIIVLIKNNSVDEIKRAVESIPDYLVSNKLTIEDLSYLWNQIVSFLSRNYSKEISHLNVEFMDYEQIISQFKDIEELCKFLIDMIFCTSNKENTCISTVNTNIDFSKMIKYIDENYCKPLFLRELAKQFYINQNYCCYLFKKFTGGTFSDHINKLRIEKSKLLLENSTLTIEQISQQVGYNDYFYYNKVFKKYYDTTPSKYRKDVRVIKD